MDLTPHAQLQQWLILTLGELNGSASRAKALDQMEVKFGSSFTPDDLDSPPTRPFETKWRNRVSWQRDRMVKAGLLDPFEGHGTPWKLTDDGWSEYEAIQSEASLDDPFAHFKPKDASDYVARVTARRMVKRRFHERLIADFGRWCAGLGFAPDTSVHPRDLIVKTAAEEWLVEAKIVKAGNATNAVRAALAQALMYQHFLHPTPGPRLLALFSETVGDAHVAFLEAHGIASAWCNNDGHWDTSSSAAVFRSNKD